MKELSLVEASALAVDCLSHGRALLNVGGDRPNTMTIGWGSIGYFWNKPVFMAVIRPQRHTLPILLEQKQFTVSMGVDDAHKALFMFAGKNSGAEVNKFEGHGLTAVPARKVNAPIVGECELHIECRTLLEQDMTPDNMDRDVIARAYPSGDYHKMIFGEIVACYRTDE